MGIKSFVKQILTEKENRKYAKLLQEKRFSYGEWAAREVGRKTPRAKRENELVVINAGEGFFSAELSAGMQGGFPEYGEAGVLYGDEDVWEQADGKQSADPADRQLPWFKPEWSPDLLDSFFYFGSVVIIRKELFLQAPGWEDFLAVDREQKRDFTVYKVTDFPAYERWMHSCVRLAGGYNKGSRTVKHIPEILFHSVNREVREKFFVPSPFLRECRQQHLQEFRRSRGNNDKPVISIIIPSKDQPEILGKCVEGCILAAGCPQDNSLIAEPSEDQGKSAKCPETGGVPVEIIVVDNGSSPENRGKVQKLLQETNNRCCRTVYLYRPQEFNFSGMCNQGADRAEGRFLLFLNDDVELCCPGCLERMAALADREITGAVGLKLYYPDSRRIQHVGITNLPMGPVHKLQFLEDDRDYYYGSNRGYRNVLAVTAACLMTEQGKYREAGGFAEELQVAFNDVDFCFRLYELGYQNVCDNEDYAFHHESLSRGADEAPEKLERLLKERDGLYKRHRLLEGTDPYYSLFLNREGLDTGIRPACLTAGNKTQEIRETLEAVSLRDYRRDDCLMVRIEDSRAGRILGYGVILGDNNGCYDRMLLLGKAGESSGEGNSAVFVEESNCEGNGAVSEREDGREGNGVVSERKDGREGNGAVSEREDSREGNSAVFARNNCHEENRVVYAARLQGQYRPDLEENMPDQVRVGLCGFDVKIDGTVLPPGRYRLGMAARNKVTGLKLINWSNRFLEMENLKAEL